MPASQKRNIETWRTLMPDYSIKRWDESNFDINANVYVGNAYRNRKYAFVSDYARLIALKNEGGFYLDTDVEVFKSFDTLLNLSFVSAIEYFSEFENYQDLLDENKLPLLKGSIIPYLGFLSAFIGTERNNVLINDVLSFYDSITADHPDYNGTVIDGILAREAVKYGFRYENTYQSLTNGMTLFSSDLFCSMPNQFTEQSYLIHRCAQSWKSKTQNQKIRLYLDKLHVLEGYKLFAMLKRRLVQYLFYKHKN